MQDIIRLVAYYNWINRGRPEDDPMIDWSAAEKAIAQGDPSALAGPFIKVGHIVQVPQILNTEIVLPRPRKTSSRQMQTIGRMLRKKESK